MPTKALLNQTEDEIDRTMKINVYAHFWVCCKIKTKSMSGYNKIVYKKDLETIT